MAITAPSGTPTYQATTITVATGLFTGGGAAADCTQTAGVGIKSVAYNAATGKYLLTLNQVPTGTFLGAQISVHLPTNTNPTLWEVHAVKGSFSAANGTLNIEAYNVPTSPALADLATTVSFTVTLTFAS